MQEREVFSGLAIVPPVFVRLDGRSFHALTRALKLKKPFDDRFHDAMCRVAVRLVRDSGLSPVFAYTFSDEISLYFTDLPFSGRIEKIDSVLAAYAASALTLELGCTDPLSFDARVIAITPDLAAAYLRDRQQEAWRNHMNSYCQQALIDDGMCARTAAAALKGMSSAAMHEMMFARGVNLARTPAWQRRGSLIRRDLMRKEGYNPVKQETVSVERSVVLVQDDLPLFSTPEGRDLVRSLIQY